MKSDNYAIDLLEDTLARGKEFLEYFPSLQNYLDNKTYETTIYEATKQIAHIENLLEKIKESGILDSEDLT